jgi:hypothetical protein
MLAPGGKVLLQPWPSLWCLHVARVGIRSFHLGMCLLLQELLLSVKNSLYKSLTKVIINHAELYNEELSRLLHKHVGSY